MEIFISYPDLGWKMVVEISTLWFVIYHILLFFEGTRAIQVLRGVVILIVAFFLAQVLRLGVLNWLLTKLFAISVIAILIIFHPEIRSGLARLGRQNIFAAPIGAQEFDEMLHEIIKSAESLCNNKVGGLITIENTDSLAEFIKTGVRIDAQVTSELVETIFTPNSLLHDGSLIISNGRIAAAGCIFPLTQNFELSRLFGTRHRAALGLSEDADAIIIVVSEERHDMSLVYDSKLYRDLGKEEIISRIKEIIQKGKRK